jgi:hypothetical protein
LSLVHNEQLSHGLFAPWNVDRSDFPASLLGTCELNQINHNAAVLLTSLSPRLWDKIFASRLKCVTTSSVILRRSRPAVPTFVMPRTGEQVRVFPLHPDGSLFQKLISFIIPTENVDRNPLASIHASQVIFNGSFAIYCELRTTRRPGPMLTHLKPFFNLRVRTSIVSRTNNY